MKQPRKHRAFTRRGFLTTAIAVAGACSAGTLSACQPQLSGASPRNRQEAKATPAFFTAPEPIDKSAVQEIVTADIIIIGAGDAGLAAAFAASSTGDKVILLEKNESFVAHGSAHACLGTKVHEREGMSFDRNEILRYLTAQSGNRADGNLLRLWADESGRIYDELINLAEENGMTVSLVSGNENDDSLFPEFNCALAFTGSADSEGEEQQEEKTPYERFLSLMEKAIMRNGCDIRYRTTVEQLTKDGDGRVCRVFAKDENDEYIEFIGAKAVILTTGDYGNDSAMVEYYCPWQKHADVNLHEPPVNTGDGHKLGLWMGGAMQPLPHCSVLLPLRSTDPAERIPLEASPVLRVNVLGKRYENESIPAPLVCEGRIRQPQNKAWAIADASWRERVSEMTPGFLRTTSVAEEDTLILKQKALHASTLEELASRMDVPVETFIATVKRYNELAYGESDDDFGKAAHDLWPVETAPFYAIEVPVGAVGTLGGLLINARMQVLSNDDQTKVVDGLYAAGNASGGFFGSSYPSAVNGIVKGWCIVGGYLAGLYASQESITTGDRKYD